MSVVRNLDHKYSPPHYSIRGLPQAPGAVLHEKRKLRSIRAPDKMSYSNNTVYLVTGANRGNCLLFLFSLPCLSNYPALHPRKPSTHILPPLPPPIYPTPQHRALPPPSVSPSQNPSFFYRRLTTNPGIGLALTIQLLERPNTTVIATRRTGSTLAISPHDLSSHVHPTSRMLLMTLDDDDANDETTNNNITYDDDDEKKDTGIATLRNRLEANGITHLDVVVANAGGSSGFKDILSTVDPDKDLLYDFRVNAVLPLKLFQAVSPLLFSSSVPAGDDGTSTSSSGSNPPKKWIYITSSVGSIGSLGEESFPSTAYGMSKAAGNWLARKLAVEFAGRGLLVGVVHPGLVVFPL